MKLSRLARLSCKTLREHDWSTLNPKTWNWPLIVYPFRAILHPVTTFQEIKYEKKGSVGLATLIILLLFASRIFNYLETSFVFNYNRPERLHLWIEFMSSAMPTLLWCIVNWSITTLMDGEGSFRDIYISTAYAMTPVIIFTLVQTVFSWVLTQDGQEIYDLLGAVGVIWTGFLAFVGMMTIQQYTIKKTIFTIIIDIIGMLVVLFLFLLFFALIQQLINFLYVLYTEFSLRL